MGAINDVRVSIRQRSASPRFVLTGLVTLGLAIGASSSIFSVVRATLGPTPIGARTGS